jgi:hypothetical protein
MKKITLIIFLIIASFGVASMLNSCSVSDKVAAKSGAQLWGENCIRCHNIPSPTKYSDKDWAVIMSHMRITAGLTGDEETKIREYLQSAN